MDLAAIPRTMLRRWLILAMGIFLTSIATVAVFTALPRSYQSKSQALILFSPNAGSAQNPTSPFINQSTGLNLLARVATADPNTARFRAEMIRDNFSARYEVAVEPRVPIVRFSVEGEDSATVEATHLELLRRFEAEIQRVQMEERVPPRQMAHVRFLDATGDPDPIAGDRLRAALATASIGLLLTLLATFLVERAFRAWAQRAAQRLIQPATVGPATAGGKERAALAYGDAASGRVGVPHAATESAGSGSRADTMVVNSTPAESGIRD